MGLMTSSKSPPAIGFFSNLHFDNGVSDVTGRELQWRLDIGVCYTSITGSLRSSLHFGDGVNRAENRYLSADFGFVHSSGSCDIFEIPVGVGNDTLRTRGGNGRSRDCHRLLLAVALRRRVTACYPSFTNSRILAFTNS